MTIVSTIQDFKLTFILNSIKYFYEEGNVVSTIYLLLILLIFFCLLIYPPNNHMQTRWKVILINWISPVLWHTGLTWSCGKSSIRVWTSINRLNCRKICREHLKNGIKCQKLHILAHQFFFCMGTCAVSWASLSTVRGTNSGCSYCDCVVEKWNLVEL